MDIKNARNYYFFSDEARIWVDEITKCLRKLNCLSDPNNEYQPMPIQQRPANDTYESVSPGLIRAKPPPPLPSPIRDSEKHLNFFSHFVVQ